ncbi:unnamed protein product [Kuraishia capsulata CBS 1993]|uniref:Smr domain-containing protein n=1 Tax=Kuraishia capsulata CBS 1993 TaxID=1382522 RepID=W6MWM6_9ASCO|nr:uncharacterized protein KUCA_T00003644001 [Kuraishia capsulata CBS 1993]CDK27665.1 unnamed protein product [Kuraishia capsulata CBS 1993]
MERGVYLSNERDYNHATDKEYEKLRKLADQAHDKRNKLSHESQSAFKRGDKAKAAELSQQAKEQLDIAERYNAQAANYVFIENNEDSDRDEIDLHGLFVKEAQYILKQRITTGIQRNETHLKVIVGKGLHSANGVAKLKPAIQELCQDANLKNYIDPKNTGVLVIELQNANIPASWSQNAQHFNMPQAPQAAYGQQQPAYAQQTQQNQQGYNPYAQQQQYQGSNQQGSNQQGSNQQGFQFAGMDQQQLQQAAKTALPFLKAICNCIKSNM